MFIDWKSLPQDCGKLDLYAVTVENGEIIKRCVYYINTDINRFDISDKVFTELSRNGSIKGFSVGLSSKNCIKYDFSLSCDTSNSVCDMLKNNFAFIDEARFNELKRLCKTHSVNIVNHVIGVNVDSYTANIKNCCFYFKFGGYFSFNDAKQFIECALSALLPKQHCAFPNIGKGSHLHMVALDFSPIGFKVKFYFKFNGDYCSNRITQCFANKREYNAAADILSCNGRLEFFQISISAEFGTSFNFYFRPKETSDM